MLNHTELRDFLPGRGSERAIDWKLSGFISHLICSPLAPFGALNSMMATNTQMIGFCSVVKLLSNQIPCNNPLFILSLKL